MSLRGYLKKLDRQGKLVKVSAPISSEYEIAGVLKKLEPSPVLFENVKNYGFRVAGNLFPGKAAFAGYFDIPTSEIIPRLRQAIDHPTPCPIVEEAPCQEVVISDPDLDDLPILRHCSGDGGRYISSGIFIAHHPVLG